ncbi:MAG: hypothetical protein ACE5OZ_14970 [Candidatus Heimdallarchaeota archaeon]
MASAPQNPPSSWEDCMERLNKTTKKAIWGFHQIEHFRKTFQDEDLSPTYIEDILMELQNELVVLLVKYSSDLLKK